MSQTNILFASDVSIADIPGGSERVLFEQTRGLVRRGYNVHILTRKPAGNPQCFENIAGVKEWRYDIDRRNAGRFLLTTLQNGKFLFEKLQNRFRFKCIHMHQPFTAFALMQSPLSKNIRKIYTCHSLSFEEYISRNRKPGTAWGKMLFFIHCCGRKHMEKKVLHQADHIMVLSRFTQKKLRNVYRIPLHKISINPGGADLKKFFPVQDKRQIRKKLHIPDDKFILFTLRNLEPRMGLENLILSLKKISEEIKDIYLIIGGEGPLMEELKKKARQSGTGRYIRFTGYIPEAKLADYYRAADFFILPTLELEGFGLVTPESLASGLPVLGTPVGGTEEILSLFGAGYLFRNTGPDAIADLIMEKYKKYREDISSWNQLSEKCRKFAEKYYSWKRNIDFMENIMKRETEKKSPIVMHL
ncbi:MAG: glycosyltransferase family 4 protein [Desulfococcaceae bacterium]|jgi:glycosyltransferase involved in cell wall biosynthesis|nr:glycosyltransferase family 4 protein [Desulfococcaceae bacterium]